MSTVAKSTVANVLSKYGACDEAIEWASGLSSRSLKRAWEECPRGDWLLWIAASIGVDRKLVALAACAVARTALKHVSKGETRPLRCIEVTEAWCRGEATIEQVREARAAAYAASAYAASAYASYASYAAANAAAYADAAYAADAAAYAAAAAVRAAAANAAAARTRSLKRSAAIVRKTIPWSAVIAAHKRVGRS